MIKGVDISEHNGNLDMTKLKNAGVDFIIARSSYRAKEDAQFRNYVTNARKSGIKVLGGYHFLYLDGGGTYANNAKKFYDVMHDVGLGDAYYMIDVEYHLWEKLWTNVTSETANRYTKEFIKALMSLGVKKSQIVIYTNLDFYKHYYDDEIKSQYKVWLADYDGEPNYQCVIQQYSSKGRIAGCNCDFDMNYLYDEKMMNSSVSDDTHTDKTEVQTMGVTAKQVLDIARGWLGWSEANGKWWEIVDGVYNNYIRNHKTEGRGYCLTKNDEWCDSFVSACIIKATGGNTSILATGVECGVGAHINIFKQTGIWYGRSHTPASGDIITFDWQNGAGSGSVWVSDHIGFVESYDANTGIVTTVEGNYGENVKRRNIQWNSACVYGYARPKYAAASSTPAPSQPSQSTSHNVQWTGYICKKTTPKLESRKDAGNMKTVQSADVNDKIDICYKENGYFLVRFHKSNTYGFVPVNCVSDKKTEQTSSNSKGDIAHATSRTKFTISKTGSPNRKEKCVGKVTADDFLNIRTWAGTDADKCKSRGPLGFGNLVSICDSILDSAGTTWYYVYIADAKIYAFACADYIEII